MYFVHLVFVDRTVFENGLFQDTPLSRNDNYDLGGFLVLMMSWGGGYFGHFNDVLGVNKPILTMS